MGKHDHYKAQDFIDAIPNSGGIVTTIARRVGCDWHTAKKYIDGYPTVKRAYADECERVLDKAEHNVIAPIMEDRDDGAILSKWYLTMKGGGRGYVQTRQGKTQNLNIDVSKLTDEQLERIANGEDPVAVFATTG